ncbi:MAG: hypothetical protein AAFR17_14825 [Pseudomonadota bacterium]
MTTIPDTGHAETTLPRRNLDWDRAAFWTAALAAPFASVLAAGIAGVGVGLLFAVGIGGVWVGLAFAVPAFVIAMPAYLLLGLPAFWMFLRRGVFSSAHIATRIALAGAFANLGTYPLYFIGLVLNGDSPVSASSNAAGAMLGGFTYGTLTSLLFAWIYWGSMSRRARNGCP